MSICKYFFLFLVSISAYRFCLFSMCFPLYTLMNFTFIFLRNMRMMMLLFLWQTFYVGAIYWSLVRPVFKCKTPIVYSYTHPYICIFHINWWKIFFLLLVVRTNNTFFNLCGYVCKEGDLSFCCMIGFCSLNYKSYRKLLIIHLFLIVLNNILYIFFGRSRW